MGEQKQQHVEEPDVMRGMRLGFGDENIFWFRDDLHNPYPITPFGMSTVQRGHMWGYALAADEAKLPPSRGAAVKTYKSRVYLGFVGITDPKEIEARAQHFGPYIQNSIENWQSFYGGYMKEGAELTIPNTRMDLSRLSYGELAGHLRKCQQINLKCWKYHFLTMYVADTVYMGGEEFAGKYGLEEKDYTMMLKGFETKGLATDRGQFLLAKSAMARKGVLELLESNEPVEVIMEKVKETDEGREWWKEVEAYLDEFGHRISAAVLDMNFTTWCEDPSPVIENLCTMLPRVKGGWDFEEEHQNTIRLREEAVEEFRKKLKPEDKEAFETGLTHWQNAYQFNEDHWFYFEQVNWSGFRYGAMEAGRRFTELGILKKPEDVVFLTYEEILETLGSCGEASEVAGYAYSYVFQPLVASRIKQYEQAQVDRGPAFLGVLPEAVEDPIAIKVFGLTDFVLDKARTE